MTGIRCCLALLLLIGVTAELSAQLLIAPFPGVGFGYRGHHLAVSGFVVPGPYFGGVPYYPWAPYGIVQNRVSVQFITPTVLVAPRRATAVEDYDLSGVDLDVVPASAIWGEPAPRPELARNAAARPGRPERVAAPRKQEVPRKVEAPPPPKKVEPPPPPKKVEPPPPKPPVDDLWVPRAEPAAEARRLLELGSRAFGAEEYGLASLRFRQATEVDPSSSLAFFLHGHAEYALGKYREAVRALGESLRLQPDIPARDFRAREDLYRGNEEAWTLHRKRLLDAHKLRPGDGEFLFLLGTIDWFGDRRREAVDWFRQARLLLPDRPWVDLFLKSPAAPVPPV